MMNFRSIQNLNVRGKAVIVRTDFNIPCGNIEDVKNNFRIRRTMPTVQYLLARGARVVLMSHLEENGHIPSLRKISKGLRKYFLPDIKFVEDLTGSLARQSASSLQPGGVMLLDNLRRSSGEAQNKENFAKSLASLGDIYINEAFSASHRPHASIVGIPKFLPGYPGFLFKDEIDHLSKIFNPPRPFFLIIGGKKISKKLKIIEKFLAKADLIFVGGAMANVFVKAAGHSIGNSYIEDGSDKMIKEKFLLSKKILLPVDAVVKRGVRKKTVPINSVKEGDIIYDSGPKTLKVIEAKIKKSRFVLWNGPLGYFEGGFRRGSFLLADFLKRAKAEVIVGGGDTIVFLESRKFLNDYSFVSTGGGAMLEFLVEETLPGIEALKRPRA